MKIGIVGFGFVGQALYNSIKNKETVIIYDKFMEDYQNKQPLQDCDVLYICLPTINTKEKQDVTPFTEFFEFLEESYFNGLIVVKSTILYENLKPFTKKYNIVMNPEFLNQNTSMDDFKNQTHMVLGGRIDLCQTVQDIYEKQFIINQSCTYDYVTIEQACEFKYLRNIYGAYKVLFWNFVNESFNTDVRKLAMMLENMPQGEMSNIAADGHFGFGGACLPKDLQAKHTSFKHDLSDFMLKYNKKLRK